MRNNLHGKKAVGYLRVSSKGQVTEGSGIEGQEYSCRNFAQYNGFEVVEFFKDPGVSGGVLNRPGIQKLFSFVEAYNKEHVNAPIEILLTDSLDRVARDMAIYFLLKEEAKKRGLIVVMVNQSFEETPTGKFMEQIQAGFAELYRGENRERVISRQRARLEAGYRAHPAPEGYQYVKADNGGKILIRHEPNATIVQEALQGYADGVLNALPDVMAFIESRGLVFRQNKNKKDFRNLTKAHKSFVSRMMKNILYTGYLKSEKLNVPLTKAKHEAFISMDTYNKIQERLAGKGKCHEKPRKRINPVFPLKGHIECECCGYPMTSSTPKGKFPYYIFNRRCPLSGRGILAKKVHDDLISKLEKVSIDTSFNGVLKALVLEEYEKRKTGQENIKSTIEHDIKKIDADIQKIIDSIATTESRIVREGLEKRAEAMNQDKQLLTARLYDGDIEQEDMNQTIDLAFAAMENPYKLWLESDIDDKRLLLDLWLCKKIKVKKNDRLYITIDFSDMLSMNYTRSEAGHLNWVWWDSNPRPKD